MRFTHDGKEGETGGGTGGCVEVGQVILSGTVRFVFCSPKDGRP